MAAFSRIWQATKASSQQHGILLADGVGNRFRDSCVLASGNIRGTMHRAADNLRQIFHKCGNGFVQAGHGGRIGGVRMNDRRDPALLKEKISALAAAAAAGRLSVAVDDPQNAEALSAAASAAHSELGVLIEVDVGMGRGGVRSPSEAVTLAERVARPITESQPGGAERVNRRLALPHVPVQFLGNRLGGAHGAPWKAAARHNHTDLLQSANAPVPHQVAGNLILKPTTLLCSDLNDPPGFRHHLPEDFSLVDGERHRLLAVHVLPRAAGVNRDFCVPVVARGAGPGHEDARRSRQCGTGVRGQPTGRRSAVWTRRA